MLVAPLFSGKAEWFWNILWAPSMGFPRRKPECSSNQESKGKAKSMQRKGVGLSFVFPLCLQRLSTCLTLGGGRSHSALRLYRAVFATFATWAWVVCVRGRCWGLRRDEQAVLRIVASFNQTGELSKLAEIREANSSQD